MQRYLSVKQVRERLNNAVSQRQIYRFVSLGKLHSTKAFGKVLILEASLEALLAEGRREGAGAGEAPAPDVAAAAAPAQRAARKSR